MRRRGKRSNRPTDLTEQELSKHCQIDKNCRLFCKQDGNEWFQAVSPDDLPHDLRIKYKHCLNEKRNVAHQTLMNDKPFDFEEAYQEKQHEKANPKIMMRKMADRFEDLVTSDTPEPLTFPLNMQPHEQKDKEAFEAPTILTRTRTREKKCEEGKEQYTRILQKLSSFRKDLTHDEVQQTFEHVRQALAHLMKIKDVKFIKLLGVGKYGTVFTICNPDISSDLFVVKYEFVERQVDEPLFQTEFTMQQKFFEADIAPEPKFLHLKPNLIVMAKIDGTVEELLIKPCSREILNAILESIMDIIFKMCSHNLRHRDLHWENFGYIYHFDEMDFDQHVSNHPLQRKMVFLLIDFGFARDDTCDPEAELTQLIRTSFSSQFNVDNMMYLREHLIEVYKKSYEYDPSQIENFEYWNKKHEINFFELKEYKPREQSFNPENQEEFSISGSVLSHNGDDSEIEEKSEIEHNADSEIEEDDESEIENNIDNDQESQPFFKHRTPQNIPPQFHYQHTEYPKEWEQNVNPTLSNYFKR